MERRERRGQRDLTGGQHQGDRDLGQRRGGDYLGRTATAVMLGGPAPVLFALASQVTLIGVRVGEVAGGREVDDGLGDFTKTGSHPDGQPHDEEEPHERSNIPTRVGWRKAVNPYPRGLPR